MKKSRTQLLALFLGLTALLWPACTGTQSPALHKVNRLLMGTLVEVTVAGAGDQVKSVTQAILDEIQRVENLTSFHKPSALTAMNDNAGREPIRCEPELLDLVRQSLEMARLTGGAYDPTIGPVSKLWSFSGGQPRLPSPSEIADALTRVGWERVKIDTQAGTISLPEAGMALDLGGIAKGYALDKALEVIRRSGVKAALVNAGGDIVAVGEKAPGKPWRVGVQDPRRGDAIKAVVSLKDRFIVTSGDYERFFVQDGKRYHHILNPHTGYPAEGLSSVTIIANKGSATEALAVAVSVLGAEKGLKLIEATPGVHAMLIDTAGEIRMSRGAEGMFEVRK